jgi:cytochrome c-type protein NapC
MADTQQPQSSETKQGVIDTLMNPPKCSMLRMITVGVLGGIIIWGGLNMGMEWTNRSAFCMSCHEMTIPFEELKKTVHYKNRSGTSVQCADCHVASSKTPTDYIFKSFQKLMAARDVIGHIKGTVDTPEKFEAHRLTMAERVWERMKERDSKECRNCHDFKTMDPAKQKDRSVAKHEGAVEDGKTCIDCHKGIAHKAVHTLIDKTPEERLAALMAPPAPPKPAEPAPAPKVEAAPAPAEVPAVAAKAAADAAGTATTAMATAMTTAAKAVTAAAETAAAPAKPSVAVGVDWSKAPPRTMKLFYPGQAAFEWVMNKPDHSSASDIIDKKRPCARCHEGDANEIGNAIIAGKPVGASKTVMEPEPPAGKAGFIPVTFQATHDNNKIYFRFEWTPPKLTGKKMDAKNEVKLTMMFDGGGTVDGAEINGCWSTCHVDLRTMKEPASDKKTKYIKDADLAGGKFMDLIQFRSGKGEKAADGWVDTERHMDGGKAGFKAEGRKEGNSWVVVFERELAGKGKGDHTLDADKVYNFGFAIHEDYTNARYHYVSLGYQFGLNKDNPGVKNYINVQKQ